MGTETDMKAYILANPPSGEFKPKPYYSETGDYISFRWIKEDYYATRVSDLLTLYRSTKTKKPVGIKIKSVRGMLLAKMEEFCDEPKPLTIGMLVVAAALTGTRS